MAVTMEEIVSLCKRRGFIYQGSEIYGGLRGTYDYGPLGIQLKRNITNLWWKIFVEDREDIYGIDTTILMNPNVWVASGHVDTFNDPLIEDVETKQRYRLDHILEEAGVDVKGMNLEQMVQLVQEKNIKSPDGNTLGNAAKFNLLFKTSTGSVEDEKSVVYMRGETAQGMFVNFKNIVDSYYPDLPFGLAQIGRNFRNEISPRDFIFRVREFEIAELEYFIEESQWEDIFTQWISDMRTFFEAIGLPADKIHELEVSEEDRAHYSKRTVDFEFEYPFGTKEIAGLAYRTDFDLKNHEEHSGVKMRYTPKVPGAYPFIPHVIEPTFGVDRMVLALLSNSWREDEVGGEKRMYLALPEHLAPVKFMVSPLLKNKPELVAKARVVFALMQKKYGSVIWDDNANVGKRYRRADEIGVPKCITIDFQTLEDDTVTIRDRNTAVQARAGINDL
jgi:glycyl-tRNA synthetase